MSRLYPIQDDFKGGEISPRFYVRQASDPRVANSLQECLNLIPDPYGTLKTRNGTRHLAPTNYPGKPRLFRHNAPDYGDVCLEIGAGAGMIVAWTKSGTRVVDTPSGTPENVITDPTFEFGMQYWDNGNKAVDAIPIPGIGVRLDGNFYIDRNPSIERRAKYAIVEQSLSGIVIGDTYTFTCSIRVQSIRDDQGTDGLDRAQLRVSVETVQGDVLAYRALSTPVIADNNAHADYEYLLAVPAMLAGVDYRVKIYSYQQGATPYEADYSTFLTNISMVSDAYVPPSDTEFVADSPYLDSELKALKSAFDSATRTMYLYHGAHMPLVIVCGDGGGWEVREFGTGVRDTSPLPTWGEGNYPACGTFHEGRFWAGNSEINRSTLWATGLPVTTDGGSGPLITGGLFDWDAASPDPITSASPMLFDLSARGQILSMASSKTLQVLTDNSHIIGVGSRGPLSPLDFNFPEQSTLGSSDVQSLPVGRELLYPGTGSRKILATQDAGLNVNGYVFREMSKYAEHLAREGVSAMGSLVDPDRAVMIVDFHGNLTACTYMEESHVDAWHEIVTASVNSDMCPHSDATGDSLFLVASRDGVSYLELYNPSSDLSAYVDSHVTRTVVAGVIDGLGHLDAREVTGVALFRGGFVIIPSTFVSSGEIAVPDYVQDGSTCYVGVGFTQRFKTLPLEGTMKGGTTKGSTTKGGTTLGGKSRWSRIYLDLLDSSLPDINGQTPPDRRPNNPMDLSPPMMTGLIDVTNIGWDGGSVSVEQTRPLKLQVTGIFGTSTSNKL